MANMNKVSITGDALPTGDLISYFYHYVYDTVVMCKMFNTNPVTYSLVSLLPYPPTTFTEPTSGSFILEEVQWNNYSIITPMEKTISKMHAAYFMGYNLIIGFSAIIQDSDDNIYVPYRGDDFNKKITLAVRRCDPIGKPTLLHSGYYGCIAGLGLDINNSPTNIIYGSTTGLIGAMTPICHVDPDYITADASGVLHYGCFSNTGDGWTYLLLDRTQGYVAKFQNITGTAATAAITAQITVPTGYSIIQFENGYYIVSNGSTYKLYNINNNGTYMMDLAAGTGSPAFDPSTTCESLILL